MDIEESDDNQNKKKIIYSCLATGLVFAGIAAFIMRGRYTVLQSGADGHSRVTVRPFSFFSKQIVSVVNVIEREGRGHPGYITRCLETMEDFITQGDAARSAGVDDNTMSRHIRGMIPDIKGLHYQRVAA